MLNAPAQGGGSTRDDADMQNRVTATKFEVVSGYKGSVDVVLAMERGEVEGMCGYDWSSLTSQRPDWIRDKLLNILVQVAVEPEAELTLRFGNISVPGQVRMDNLLKVHI